MIMMRKESIQAIIEGLERDLDVPFHEDTRQAIEVAAARIVKLVLDDLKVDYRSWSETIVSAENKASLRQEEEKRWAEEEEGLTRDEEMEWEEGW